MDNNPLRILIVDDESTIRDVGRRFLRRRLHANIMAVENGHDAISKSKINNYDLILLDLNIPGPNGWEVLNEIRKVNNTVKILLVSAFDEKSFTPEQINKVNTLTSGFIQKPFNLTALIEKIVAVLGESVLTNLASLDPENLKGRPEAQDIVHDLNDLHGTIRISCEEYFYSKERGYFKEKTDDKKVQHLELVLNDVIHYLGLTHKVVKRIRRL